MEATLSRLPRAVFFDLDNTLTHRALSLARYANRFFADFAHIADSTADLQALTACIVQADSGGYLPAGSRYKTIKETVAHAVSAMRAWGAVPAASIFDHWATHLPPSSVAMPGAEALIYALAAAGVHVGIISNGAEHTRLHSVQALPFAAHVSQLLSSDAVGIRKPDSRIFHLAAQRAGCAVEDCCYVGDHPLNDVEGARTAGMLAIWLRGFHDWTPSLAPPAHAVDHLDEVMPILRDGRSIARENGRL